MHEMGSFFKVSSSALSDAPRCMNGPATRACHCRDWPCLACRPGQYGGTRSSHWGHDAMRQVPPSEFAATRTPQALSQWKPSEDLRLKSLKTLKPGRCVAALSTFQIQRSSIPGQFGSPSCSGSFNHGCRRVSIMSRSTSLRRMAATNQYNCPDAVNHHNVHS